MKPDLYKQSSVVPTRKVTAGTLAAAVSVIAVWVAGQAGLEVPAEVASAFTTLLGFIAAYFIHDGVQV